MKGHFTEQEIEFIKENYPKYGSDYCCQFINQPNWRIQKRASHLGIKILKENIHSIRSKNSKISWKNKYENKQKQEFDNFIRNLLSPITLYFLGFLWGDGHLEKSSNRISIKIQSKDGRKLKNIFNKVFPFKIKIQKNWRYEIKNKNSYQFRHTNRLFYSFLVENDYLVKSGTSPDKILSRIPFELQCYWWRGYSDADGCFYHKLKQRDNNYSFASTYDQDWNFIKNIEKYLNIKFTISRRKFKSGSSSIACLTKIDEICRFRDYIYQNYDNDNIGLRRKYKKAKLIYYRPKNEKANGKKNKTTGFIGIYKCRKTFIASIDRKRMQYRVYSNDLDRVIEAYDRLVLDIYPENYVLNRPERLSYYLEENRKQSPKRICSIRELDKI